MKLHVKDIKPNLNNPRTIKDDNYKKLVKSLKVLPIMLNKRPLLIDIDNIIIGGNMRYRAAVEAGIKEVPIERFTLEDAIENNKLARVLDPNYIDKTYEEQREEMIIKDNVSGGDWDWDSLANEWDTNLLQEWGLDLPEIPDFEPASEDEQGKHKYIYPLTKDMRQKLKSRASVFHTEEGGAVPTLTHQSTLIKSLKLSES